MAAARLYDAKCAELARAFLREVPALDTEEYVAELAKDIQETIEDFISYETNPEEPLTPPSSSPL